MWPPGLLYIFTPLHSYMMIRSCYQAEVAFLGSCHRQNKQLRSRDTIAKQSESFIWTHSKERVGQSQGRQSSRSISRKPVCHILAGRTSLTRRDYLTDRPTYLASLSVRASFPAMLCGLATSQLRSSAPGLVWPGPDRQEVISANPLLSPHEIPTWAEFGWFFSLNLILLSPGCLCLSF